MTVLPPGAIARPAPVASPSGGGGGFRAQLAQAEGPKGASEAGAARAPAAGPRAASAVGPPEGHLTVAPPAGEIDPARASAAFLHRALEGQRSLDSAVAAARRGRTFSPAELLGLQARLYRATEAVQLFSKTVEQTSAAVQQTLRTPV